MNTLLGNRTRKSGFSLAEVMIALGIVAFVMMGLLGTMVRGTQSVQNATNTLIYGKIADQMVNDIQQLNWTLLPQEFPAEKEFYFDYQGFPIQKTDQGKSEESAVDNQVSFVAKVRYNTDADVVSAGNTYDNELLRKIQILVEYTPGGKPARWDLKPRKGEQFVQSFIYMVANQNKIVKLDQRD